MSDDVSKQNSLISVSDVLGIGKLSESKAAERLVDGIVQGVGVGFRCLAGPWLLKREASAQIDIAKRVLGELPKSVSLSLDLDQRAKLRIERDESNKQLNREVIAELALANAQTAIDLIEDEGDDEKGSIDYEWLAEFWGRSEQVTNEHMRVLWAKVLLRKAIAPNNFSLRSLALVGQLSYDEAIMIERLAPFVVQFDRNDRATQNFAGGLIYNIGHEQGAFTVAKDAKEQFREQVLAMLPDFDLVTLSAAGIMQSTSYWANEYSISYSREVALRIGSHRFVLEGLPHPNEKYAKNYSIGSGRGFTPEGCEVAAIINAQPDPQFVKLFRATIEAASCRLIDVVDE